MTGGELSGNLIAGVLLTFVASYLKIWLPKTWPSEAKVAFVAVLALVAAVVNTWITADFDNGVFADWGIIFATASTFYTAILEKTGLEQSLRKGDIK